jgi:aerobic-type carbon monoxide dehydrogenase small subunit (CoxS/CutS family)
MPLLWVLRDTLGMTGTKFGCGMALCGACTVHIDGRATRSCVTPISAVAGKEVTTIEGLSADRSHPVQKAWIESTCRNAATASPGRSCPQRRCWRKIRSRAMRKSTKP